MRISREKYFMEIAKIVAKRSPCLSRQVGAIIVGDNKIISTGYNGPPSGYPHCRKCNRKVSGQDLDSCPAIHAEVNALLLCSHSRIKPETIYVTLEPCFNCCKLIATYDIKNIVFLNKYAVSDLCNNFLKQCNIRKKQYGTN